MVRPRRVKGRVLKQRDWHRTPKKAPDRLRLTDAQKKKQGKDRMFAYLFLGGIFAVLLIIILIKKFAG